MKEKKICAKENNILKIKKMNFSKLKMITSLILKIYQ